MLHVLHMLRERVAESSSRLMKSGARTLELECSLRESRAASVVMETTKAQLKKKNIRPL